MSRYPGAEWRPVARYLPGGSSYATSPGQRRLILHTAVTNADSLFNSMNTPGTPTSHFYVDQNGRIEQYVDTSARSSANLDGNHDCITVESWDGYGVSWSGSAPGPRWTDAQIDALVKLARWAHETHGIPIERLPSSRPGTTGVGWHRLGCDGNYEDPPGGLLGGRVEGGERWSTSAGKVCPTTTRIRQIVDEIIPGARAADVGDDMPQFDDKIPGTDNKTFGDALRAALQTKDGLGAFREAEAARDREFAAAIDALPAAVEAALPSSPDGRLTKPQVRDAVRRGVEDVLSRVAKQPAQQ